MRIGFIVMAGLSVSLLTGCDQYRESNLSTERAMVEQSRYSVEVPVDEVNDGYYKALARDYKKHGGDNDLYLTFVYNPHSKHNTAMQASNRAVEAAKALRAAGVANVKTDILPANDIRRDGSLLVSYTRYTAHAPKDCTTMPGLESTKIETDWKYKQGCSIETYLARQIARPRDLAGQGGLPELSSGRRAAILSAPYEAGIPNQPLEGGESASEGTE